MKPNLCLVITAIQRAIVFVMLIQPASAQTTWQVDPNLSGDWSTAANWSSGVPSGALSAVINNGGTSLISQNVNADDLIMGSAPDRAGHVVQSAGTVLLDDVYVGDEGTGSYELSGGDFYGDDVFVAAYPGSHGTVSISDGYFRPGYLLLGRRFGPSANGGTASVVQTGGIVEIFYAIVDLAGEEATYELHGGTLKALDQIIRGNGLGSRFVQTGGTNDARNSSGGGYGQGLIRVGVEGDDEATYELIDGDVLSTFSYAGAYMGRGQFIQTGGNHHVFDTAYVGSSEMSEGMYHLEAGTLTVDGLLSIGDDGGFGTGVGEFIVHGSESALQVGNLSVDETGIMSFGIDGTGVTSALVTTNASVIGTLKVIDNGARTGEFPLLEVGGILDFNPQDIQLPGPNWSLQLTNQTLSVVYVPEPRTALLLVIGLLSLVVRSFH